MRPHDWNASKWTWRILSFINMTEYVYVYHCYCAYFCTLFLNFLLTKHTTKSYLDKGFFLLL